MPYGSSYMTKRNPEDLSLPSGSWPGFPWGGGGDLKRMMASWWIPGGVVNSRPTRRRQEKVTIQWLRDTFTLVSGGKKKLTKKLSKCCDLTQAKEGSGKGRELWSQTGLGWLLALQRWRTLASLNLSEIYFLKCKTGIHEITRDSAKSRLTVWYGNDTIINEQ